MYLMYNSFQVSIVNRSDEQIPVKEFYETNYKDSKRLNGSVVGVEGARTRERARVSVRAWAITNDLIGPLLVLKSHISTSLPIDQRALQE